METNKEGFIEYKGKILQGSLGDMETEWWTEKDWEKHAKHVEELKAKGEYLKPIGVTILVKPHPIFDARSMTGRSAESFRFVMLNIGSDKNTNIQKMVRVSEPFVKEESLEEKYPEIYKIIKEKLEKALKKAKDKRVDKTDLPL